MKIETLAQVSSCEFCEISKNTFFTDYVWVTAFESWNTTSLCRDYMKHLSYAFYKTNIQ